MQFQFDHNNLNVLDLERSVEFYKKPWGCKSSGAPKPTTTALPWCF